MDSLAGKLLIAAPDLRDPNFMRAVVLMIHHDEEGGFGVVINRPAGTSLDAVWQDALHEPCPGDQPLMIGGPVEGPLVALHDDPGRAEHTIVPGVCFTRHKDHIVDLVGDAWSPLIVLAGYSGWGGGQLEAEMETGSWIVADASSELVFGDVATLWQRAMRHAADERLVEWLRIRHVPDQPWHN